MASYRPDGKPYSRNSQPYVIERWLDGDPKPGRTMPRWNELYKGVMLTLKAPSLCVENGALVAYGTPVAWRHGKKVHLLLECPSSSVASIARRVGWHAGKRGWPVLSVGSDGSVFTGALRRLAAVQHAARRKANGDQWRGVWRIRTISEEIATLAAHLHLGLDPDDLFAILDRLTAWVVTGRMHGWGEDKCQDAMNQITKAQHAIEVKMPRRRVA